MIKAICVDLDGVYFTEKGKKTFDAALVALSEQPDKVRHVMYKSAEMRDFVLGKMTAVQFLDHLRSELGLTLSDEELTDLWVAGYEINQEVLTFVKDVKQKGYKLCICSNNNALRIAALGKMFPGFEDDFDVRIYSYEVGATKPSREVFEALVAAAGVEPNEIVYADDNPDRLAGAQELGINTFVFHNFEQYVEELRKLGVEC